MKLPGQAKQDQEYEYDQYNGQYYKRDPGHIIRRRIAIANHLTSTGKTKAEAWGHVFSVLPKTYEDPMTGEAYPKFDPSTFVFPTQ